jgi:hypothetical protein
MGSNSFKMSTTYVNKYIHLRELAFLTSNSMTSEFKLDSTNMCTISRTRAFAANIQSVGLHIAAAAAAVGVVAYTAVLNLTATCESEDGSLHSDSTLDRNDPVAMDALKTFTSASEWALWGWSSMRWVCSGRWLLISIYGNVPWNPTLESPFEWRELNYEVAARETANLQLKQYMLSASKKYQSIESWYE